MKIQSVHIKNFRMLKNVTIDFDSVTTFIGPNGAGKSTALRALDWFFNGGKGCELGERDCSFGAVDEDIEVRVTFSSLTKQDREALERFAPAEATTFTAWKVHSADGAEVLSTKSKVYPPFADIRSQGTATEKKAEYNRLRSGNACLELPAWTNQDAALEAMAAWEVANKDELVDASEFLPTNFFGFNNNGTMSGLFDFVLVAGDLRASEETQDSKTSIIGRILERVVDRTAADEEIKKIVVQSRAAQQAVCDEKFSTQLDAIETQLNEVVSSYSPGRSICIAPAEVELKAPRTTFDVSVLDGLTKTTVDGQGHGFQRTLLISALQVLAESAAAGAEGVFCLAIEEPELFQHPTQAQAFARVLRSLADAQDKRVQVVYATHSPFFVEARHFHQVRRFTRCDGDPPSVAVHSSTVDKVKLCLSGVLKPEVVDSQLEALTRGQFSTALFSSRALVVEGTTDSAVFYGVGDRGAPARLESAGVAVVPAGGKGRLPLAHAVLTCLGIPAYAVFDADSKFEDRARANGKSQKKIDKERQSHVANNKMLAKYFELEDQEFPAQAVEQSVAVFGDNLEAFLEAEWPEWVASCTEIEATAGVLLKKNQVVYRTATANAVGVVPEFIEAILKKVEEA